MGWNDPGTWADDALTASELNRDLVANMRVLGDVWETYPVNLSGWTLVNGILEGRVQQLGKLVRGRVEYTIGSTDTKSGQPTFSLPIAVSGTGGSPIGHAGLAQGSVRQFWTAIAASTNGSTFVLRPAANTTMSPTVPWTWATGNQMLIQFRYETT